MLHNQSEFIPFCADRQVTICDDIGEKKTEELWIIMVIENVNKKCDSYSKGNGDDNFSWVKSREGITIVVTRSSVMIRIENMKYE